MEKTISTVLTHDQILFEYNKEWKIFFWRGIQN